MPRSPSSTKRKSNGGKSPSGKHLCEIEDPLPTPEELDELGPDEAIRRIESVVENNTQLCFAVDGDTRSWGEMAVARVKARAKAKTKTAT
jgi:hypothetical protein